ncbi:chemotaxis protein [Afipia sp. P52-10]|jgi:methyl-accepting chemotaxis protein|uniref:methyl-accepting chemotaxis protein n=1 Tax=Afipia sp. P52-10 TaxID=1429916 RepID=UPI0003DF0507|nr:methyl-accepting chemotaxis protein [Afipia sp. P52-10]ETR76292.1 chemotaxis protein [Afipia sp. P52-10]
MLSRLSIRSKLVAVVSFLLLAILAVGLLGLRQMNEINNNLEDVRINWLPSVRVIGELRAGLITYRNVVREHMLSETLETKAAQEKTLATVTESNDKLRQQYEKLIASPQERALYDEWSKLLIQYRAGVEEVMALSRKGAGKIPTEAHALNTQTVNPMGLKADEVLRKLIDLNNAGADTAGQEAAAGFAFGFKLTLALLTLAMAGGLCAALYIVRDVNRGISSIISPMRALGQGDLSAEVPHQGEKTEIGQMADALQVFKTALIAKKAADEAAAVEAEAKIQRAHRVDGITREFEAMIGTMVGSLSSASTELEAAANTLTSTAETTQHLSGSAAEASRDVSDNVQSVAAASEEITSSVNEISRQVQESSRVAQEAVQQAQKTDDSITELSQAAARIGNVVKLITAVAEQTNLLALNATIEAARAGEAGRGFAVVASEVKALAAQTAKATEEIGTQIAGMQNATETSVTAIREIGKTIATISEISSTIAAAVEEQGAATKEIARNMQQASQLSTQVATNVTDVSKGAGETGSASAQVLSSAQSLSRESNQLRMEVDKFLEAMRAA